MTSGVTDKTKEVKDIGKTLDELRREIRADFRALKEGVKYYNDTCDGVAKIKNEIKKLRKEIKKKKKKDELTVESRKLNAKIKELEQYQQSNNLKIKGVPEEGDAYDESISD